MRGRKIDLMMRLVSGASRLRANGQFRVARIVCGTCEMFSFPGFRLVKVCWEFKKKYRAYTYSKLKLL